MTVKAVLILVELAMASCHSHAPPSDERQSDPFDRDSITNDQLNQIEIQDNGVNTEIIQYAN